MISPLRWALALGALVVGLGLAWLWRGRRASGPAPGPRVYEEPAAAVPVVQKGAPAAWPAGSGSALPQALGIATLALWRRAFGLAAGPLNVPAGHGFVATSIEQALQADSLGGRYFPRRPLLMPQLQAAANDPEAPPTRLAEIIQQDPVLTGDVLRLANSVYYRRGPNPVESLQRAVIACGTDGLQSLAATALVQPVFRSNSQGTHRFAQLLWERSTRGAMMAEACARQWCPQDRQAAHLLPLLAALGPLVAYRMIDDAYRAANQRPSADACLALVLRYGPQLAARVAGQWQVPARLVQALSAETPSDPEQAAAQGAMLRAWQGGELLATLSLLVEEGLLEPQDALAQATQAGIPAKLYEAIQERLAGGHHG